MAKDAQGHGSNGRGGSMETPIGSHRWPSQQPIRNVPSLAKYTGAQDAWSSTPGGDREAAAALSSGGPKSATVPVHDSMGGYAEMAAASKTNYSLPDKSELAARRAASLERVSY